MKKEYKEIRQINAYSLRRLCISKRWYAAYNHLLYDLADDKENITTEDIVEIAQDIMEHSNTDQELTSICFDVARIANTFFEEV